MTPVDDSDRRPELIATPVPAEGEGVLVDVPCAICKGTHVVWCTEQTAERWEDAELVRCPNQEPT